MTVQQTIPHPLAIKLTVDDFLLLDEAGALDDYGNTELLDGTIVAVSPQHSAHYMAKCLLYRVLADACDALGTGLQAWSEGSIAMAPHNAPLPDIFVTNVTPAKQLIGADTVVLIAEVSSTSLTYDLDGKAIIYATNRIPEYWVVDVEARTILQFWAPEEDRYTQTSVTAFGERVAAVTIPGLFVDTRAL